MIFCDSYGILSIMNSICVLPKLQKAQERERRQLEGRPFATRQLTNHLPILSDNLFQHLLLKFVSREGTIYARQLTITQRFIHTYVCVCACVYNTCKITGKLIFLTFALAQSQAQLCAKFIAQLMFGPRIKFV